MISVEVDGAAIEAGRLEMQYQAEPYPGGARYEVSVADKGLIEIVSRRFKLPVRQSPSGTDTNSLFNMLRLYVSLHGDRGAPQFWANNIETISIEGATLRISGVCSPHIRSIGSIKSDRSASATKGTEKASTANAGRDTAHEF